MTLHKEIIEILACPKCKGPLKTSKKPEGFSCAKCNLLYKTEDDIPNFLIDEAVPLKTQK